MLQSLSDRLLDRFVPNSTAAASCNCASGAAGPCFWIEYCGGGMYKDCWCKDFARNVGCTGCHR
jgi:hypothetical protein